MKEESAVASATVPDSRPRPETRPGKKRPPRRPERAPSQTASARFFLSKSENNGVPLLDQEFKSEAEAMIESLKTGKSYFVVSEWRGMADFSKKLPQIRQESVTRKHL